MLHFHVEATQAHEIFSKFCKAVFVWPDLMAFEVLVCAWEPQCLKKVISSIFSAVSGMDSFPEISHVWACLVLNIIETTLFFRNYPSKLTNSCLQSRKQCQPRLPMSCHHHWLGDDESVLRVLLWTCQCSRFHWLSPHRLICVLHKNSPQQAQQALFMWPTQWWWFLDAQLDAGVPEKLILLSRDERSMLIASYADLKRCLESVYQDLLVRVFIISSLNTFTIGVDSAIMDEVIDKRFCTTLNCNM